MWIKLKKSNSIKAGLAAVITGLANLILQIKLAPEGVHVNWLSVSGAVIIALFALGIFLVFWSIFHRELVLAQKIKILEDRKTYLPTLRDTIDKMLARKYDLAVQAGKLPLEDYHKRYLSRNDAYDKVYKGITNADDNIRRKVAIIIALKNQKFFNTFNPYLSELEHSPKDPLYEYQTTCNNLVSRCGDRDLDSAIKELFKTANRYHLALVLSEMGLSSELHLKAAKYYKPLYQKPELLKWFVTRSHDRVNKKIDSLQRGDDL